MIVTEEEAKTKICQEQFEPPLYHPQTAAIYRAPRGTCIGADCMAWRWLDQVSYITAEDEPRKSSLGYCGKAGKP